MPSAFPSRSVSLQDHPRRTVHGSRGARGLVLGTVFASITLSGCTTASYTAGAAADASKETLQGVVRSGQQPVGNASIQLYAAGTLGSGSAATPLLTQPVLTDAIGKFSLSGKFTCPSASTPVYLVASGGNPGLLSGNGAGTDNQALTLLNALGDCGTLTPSESIVVNEVTTVAAVAALAPYMQSVRSVGSSTDDVAGLSAAFQLAASFADSTSGLTPGAVVPAGFSVPADLVASSADLLAGCVHSAGGHAGDGSSCGLLFSYATPSGAASPTNTADAALAIANNSARNASALYSLIPAAAPFQPQLAQAPPDWSIRLIPNAALTGAPLPQPTKLAFLTQPLTATAGAALSPAVRVAVEDATGTVLSGSNVAVTIKLGSDPSGAVLGGTLTVSAVNGVATFADLRIASAGQGYTLVSSGTSLASATSSAFNILAPATPLPLVTARAADSFVDSIGMDVHFNYYGSIYTNNTPLMVQSLKSLGVRHLRDAMCWQGGTPHNTFYILHQQLGAMGFKTDYVPGPVQPLDQILIYPTLVPDMEAVEPANEYDISGDPNWAATITAQVSSIYKALHASAATSKIIVLAPSLAYPLNAPKLGNMNAVSDAGNLHGYFGGFNPGSSTINPSDYLQDVEVNTPGKPIWVTETGYFAQPGPIFGMNGISEAAQATYYPRNLLEYANSGAARIYMYELADDLEPGQEPTQFHWGLIDPNGRAKPAFGAVAGLLTMLSDPGVAFTPTPLAFSLSNAGPLVHHSLFQKRDGSYYLAVWLETSSYDFLKEQPITVPSQTVTLNLGRAVVSVQRSQWDQNGHVASASLVPSQTISLSVSDKLQVIKLVLK